MLGPLKLRLLAVVKLMSPKISLSSTINGNLGMTYLLDLIENKIDFSDLTDLRTLSIKNSPLHLENMNIVIRYWHEGQTAYGVIILSHKLSFCVNHKDVAGLGGYS